MSIYGPFNVAPRIIQRSTNFIDLMVRNRPGTNMYRLWGANNVNDAYGPLVGAGVSAISPTAMMTVIKDGVGQSLSVVRRNWRVEESRRGQTTFQFDMDDYVTPAVPPPFQPDEFPVFVRLQENRAGQWLTVAGPVNNGAPILGPMLYVPPVSWYGRMGTQTVTIYGIAPAGTGCALGQYPVVDTTVQTPLPMHFLLPKVSSFKIIALEAGKSLLFSSGLNGQMVTVTPDNPLQFDDSLHGINEVVLAGMGAPAPFMMVAAGRIAG